MAGRNSPLVLVVDAKVDGLKAGAQAVQKTLKELEASGGEFAEVFDRQMAEIGNSSAQAIADATKRLTGDIAKMRREAEQAAQMGTSFNPAGGFSSSGQQQLADNFSANAAKARQLEAAYRAVAAGNAEMRVQATGAANELRAQAAAFALDAEAAQRNADLLHKVEQQMATTGNVAQVSGAKVAGASGQMRAGMQQLSFQVSDVATQFASGTPPMQIFAQQGGQVVQSLQLMGGEAKGFLGILGGPWGIVITAGITILGALVSKLLDGKDAAEEAAEKLDKLQFASDGVAQAQSILGEMFDLSTGALKKQNDILRLNVELMALKARADAEAARSVVGDAISTAGRWAITPGSIYNGQAYMQQPTVAKAKLQGVVDGKLDPVDVAKWAAGADFSNSAISREDFLNALARAVEVKAKSATADAIEQSLTNGRLDASLIKPDKPKKPREASVNEQASIGDMTALLKSLFPNAVITSTTGGKHVKGSDHYAKRALDFVVPGMMDSEGFDQVKSTLADAGVTIRRNANGTQQFFGPGHGASKPGDHDDHFHLAWEGKASPESAQRIADRRAEEDKRNAEALEGAELASKEEATRIAREGVSDARRLADLDKAAVDAALERKLAANAKLKLDHTELDELDRANAAARKKAIDDELARDLAVRAIEREEDKLADAAELLQIEGQIAPTLKERRKIAEQLLELDRQIRLKKIDELLAAGRIDPAEAERQRGQVEARNAGQKKALKEDNLGALGRYSKELHGNVDEMDQALENVAAHGLQGLEDGLLGLIEGTESVASAFKKMAAAIIADLARIAIEKAILSVIGFSSGDVPGHATGHIPGFASGVISGPGTGTSDSILAWHEGMGMIRVSNGESIITAAGTRKHRKLLKAINDDALPAFAGGMVASVGYPSIPSGSSLRAGNDNGPSQYFDLRGAVVTEQLYRDMHAIGAAYGAKALAAAPSMTREELGDVAMQRIPV